MTHLSSWWSSMALPILMAWPLFLAILRSSNNFTA